MPFPLDSDTEAAIATGRIRDACLVDLYLADSGGAPLTLRFWNWPDATAYPGTPDLDGSTAAQTYDSLAGRFTVSRGIRQAASLAAEPLTLTLDGSRSGDDADIVGRFVDADWHQRRMRVRCVMRNLTTGALHAQPHWEWRGLIDHRNLVSREGQPQIWETTCQGGLFRVRGRRLRTRSHEDQQRRSAGDLFYAGTPKMVAVPMFWARAQASIPGVRTQGGGPYLFSGHAEAAARRDLD